MNKDIKLKEEKIVEREKERGLNVMQRDDGFER